MGIIRRKIYKNGSGDAATFLYVPPTPEGKKVIKSVLVFLAFAITCYSASPPDRLSGFTITTSSNLVASSPFDTVFADEWYFAKLTFTNFLNRPVCVYTNYHNLQEISPQIIMPHQVRHANWSSLTSACDSVTLLPGETHVWRIWGPQLAYIPFTHGNTNITFKLMVGNSEIVESNPLPVKILDRELNLDAILYYKTQFYDSQSKRMSTFNTFTNTIEGRLWLFSDIGVRMCELKTNEPPFFVVNTNAALIEISNTVSTNTVRYNIMTDEVIP